MTEDIVDEQLKAFKAQVMEWVRMKQTGQLALEINLSQGGIGECKCRTEKRMK